MKNSLLRDDEIVKIENNANIFCRIFQLKRSGESNDYDAIKLQQIITNYNKL